MSINRTERFKEIQNRVRDEYRIPPADSNEAFWFETYAPMWRNRVGIPRLTAQEAFLEAAGLLRSVNPGLFRNDPEMQLLLRAAVNAAEELSRTLVEQNWDRFDGKGQG